MADIRVTCPTCRTQLEVDAAYEGQEVECGNCLQVFVASTRPPRDAATDRGPGGSGSGGGKIRGATSSSRGRSSRDRDRDEEDDEDDRPRRGRRRRDEDDEDDFDYDPRPRRRGGSGSNALAITSLVLGIVSFIPGCCCVFVLVPTALGAIVTGALGLKNEEGKGMAIAGLVLGCVALALFGLNFAVPVFVPPPFR